MPFIGGSSVILVFSSPEVPFLGFDFSNTACVGQGRVDVVSECGVYHILNSCLPGETTAASRPQYGDDILQNVTQGEKAIIETTRGHHTSLFCVRTCNIADVWVWVRCPGLPVFKSQSG